MFEPSAKFEVKTNNDFSFVWQYKNDDSTPISLANTTVTAQVRDSYEKLITELDVSISDGASGVFVTSLPVGFVLPVGKLYIDVFFVKNGKRINGDIIELKVINTVTHG